jgi:hypothetical protein
MEAVETAEGLTEQGVERRIMPRCVVDEEAMLLLVDHGSCVGCRIVELSMDGCRISTRARFPAGMDVRVEATFRVRGVAFRISGVAEWNNAAGMAGIRFVDLPIHTRDELVSVLCELEIDLAGRTAEQAEEQPAAEQETQQRWRREEAARRLAAESKALEVRAAAQPAQVQAEGQDRKKAEVHAAAKEPVRTTQQAARQPAGKPPAMRERRAQSRHEVDTTAIIFLINIGCRLQGRILDLSVGGCRIRTDERFPVGIYTRVETEFHLEGLPFRLGGVIQAIHDRRHVGIRFLDVSDRKRKQVEQLIGEIEEIHARQELAQRKDSDEMAV